MPETPDIQFLDNYRAAAEAAESSSSSTVAGNDSKRRNIGYDDEDDEAGYVPTEDTFDFGDEDEEGRFFGGGLTEEQSRLLDLVDDYDAEEVGRSPWE